MSLIPLPRVSLSFRETKETVRLEELLAKARRWMPEDIDDRHVQQLIDMLDENIAGIISQSSLYARAVRRLQVLCREAGRLPSSCILSSEVVLESPEPHSKSAFSDVYYARIGDEAVALKALRIHIDSKAKVEKAFYSEAVMWRSLRHPNVVPFLGVSAMMSVCLVSKWMPNGSITAFLLAHPDARRVDLLRNIVDGLRYMHSLSVIHGDLKAANILINEHSEACLSDFGLATMLHGSATMTGTSSLKGTLRWMSPELLESSDVNGGSPTVASDMYAVGMVFYEVFSGHYPYHEIRHDAAVMRHILGGKHPKRPLGAGFGLTSVIWGAMEKCWAADPSNRADLDYVTQALGKGASAQKRLRFLVSNIPDIEHPLMPDTGATTGLGTNSVTATDGGDGAIQYKPGDSIGMGQIASASSATNLMTHGVISIEYDPPERLTEELDNPPGRLAQALGTRYKKQDWRHEPSFGANPDYVATAATTSTTMSSVDDLALVDPPSHTGASNHSTTAPTTTSRPSNALRAFIPTVPWLISFTHFDALRHYLAQYLASEPPNARSISRQKLTRLTHQQFLELSTDVYDELLRRSADPSSGAVPFLPMREEFDPRRNQARQKLAPLPVRRFQDFCGDVYHELSRRYPEFADEAHPAFFGSRYDGGPPSADLSVLSLRHRAAPLPSGLKRDAKERTALRPTELPYATASRMADSPCSPTEQQKSLLASVRDVLAQGLAISSAVNPMPRDDRSAFFQGAQVVTDCREQLLASQDDNAKTMLDVLQSVQDCLSKISANSGDHDDRERPLQHRELLRLLVRLAEHSRQLPPASVSTESAPAAWVSSASPKLSTSNAGDVVMGDLKV